MSEEPGTAENVIFDSDQLSPCQCGSQTLLVEFFSNGDWVMRCPGCGGYWPVSRNLRYEFGGAAPERN